MLGLCNLSVVRGDSYRWNVSMTARFRGSGLWPLAFVLVSRERECRVDSGRIEVSWREREREGEGEKSVKTKPEFFEERERAFVFVHFPSHSSFGKGCFVGIKASF